MVVSLEEARMKHIGAACAVLVLLAGPACRSGQPLLVSSQGDMTTPGTIGGILSAVGGDRLAGRGVYAVQVGTSQRFSAVTNVTGGFTIKVPPGEYHLQVDLQPGARPVELQRLTAPRVVQLAIGVEVHGYDGRILGRIPVLSAPHAPRGVWASGRARA